MAARAKKRTAMITLCTLALVFTFWFFSPVEVLLGNEQEFLFPFAKAAWIQLAACAAVSAVLILALHLLPSRAARWLCTGEVALALCCWAQANLMNGAMVFQELEQLEVPALQKALNIAAWVLIFAAVFTLAAVIAKKKNLRTVRAVLCGISAALLAMQTAGLGSALAGTFLSDKDSRIQLTTDGEFTFAPQRNVIYLILDTADELVMEEMDAAYPEVRETLADFTWYQNATSVYSRTWPSIPYLLTGGHWDPSETTDAYVTRAYRDSTFLKDMAEGGADVRVFTDSAHMISANASAWIRNSGDALYSDVSRWSIPSLLRGTLQIAAYKDLPYALKDSFVYRSGEINSAVLGTDESEEEYFSDKDADFYYVLYNEEPVEVDSSLAAAFRFYHLWGIHFGYNWDENLEYPEDDAQTTATPVQALRGDMLLIEEFCNQLKAKGIYDQTTLIVTADHGYSLGNDQLKLPRPSCPMLLIKPAGAGSGQPMQISKAPVSHQDLFATVMRGLELDQSRYGRSVEDYSEEEQRVRTYFYTCLRGDAEGEVALREYRISGDAQDFDSWSLTGNDRNIVYSVNIVSDEQLK